MTTEITAAQLDTLAPSLWAPARESAHADMPDGSHDPANFARLYVESTARLCGGIAADQCAPGEAWAPADWLDGDIAKVREAAEAVGVTLDGADLRRLWSLYCEGDVDAAASHGAL